MAIIPLQLARVSNLLRTNVATGSITSTQSQLLEVQNEISTGKRINTPSDDPGDAAVVQQLQKTLEQRGTYLTNLKQGQSQLGEVDSTLGDITDLIKQAQTIASANVGSDVTDEERKGAATVVESIYSQAVSLANKEFGDVYVFGGDRATAPPFVAENGGVKFVGSSTTLQNTYDENTNLSFQVDGADVFGALSTRVMGTTDISPALAATTRIADLHGATNDGVKMGSIAIGTGTATATVDLSSADTIADVISAVNNSGLAGVTASIAPDGVSLQITGGTSDNITVNEVGGNTTAADLGILQTTGAGASLDGASVQAKVSPLTPIGSLRQGAGIDTTNGMTITNGLTTATINFSGATNVQDMLNQINNSGTGVQAEINDSGTGINILNPIQGTEMRISENGGQTATQLGVRSFSPTTMQSTLNGGKGVRTVTGDDFSITAASGATFNVDIGSDNDVQAVMNVINAAASAAGVNVTASFSTTGNGIVLTDGTTGTQTLKTTPLNFSNATLDLGIDQPAVGNTITGKDVGPVSAEGIFGNLAALRDALNSGDQTTITSSAEGLSADYDRVTRIHGQVGARVQEMETRQGRIEDQNLATTTLLSNLQDTDFTEAISRFQTLQTTLQATLQTTAKTINMSLMDFLG